MLKDIQSRQQAGGPQGGPRFRDEVIGPLGLFMNIKDGTVHYSTLVKFVFISFIQFLICKLYNIYFCNRLHKSPSTNRKNFTKTYIVKFHRDEF